MKFERIVLLVLLSIIIIGGLWADKKISNLENALAEEQIDTVTVEIPLVKLDTVIVTQSDTVYADVDTVFTDSGTVINHYPTATIIDPQPLFTGTYTYRARTDEWTLNYKYRNLGIHLEFPDKFDFRQVRVSTIPNLGDNITISLNDNYKPYKPPRDIRLFVGAGYSPTSMSQDAVVFLTAGLQLKKTYVGVTRSETGWGFMVMRSLIQW